MPLRVAAGCSLTIPTQDAPCADGGVAIIECPVFELLSKNESRKGRLLIREAIKAFSGFEFQFPPAATSMPLRFRLSRPERAAADTSSGMGPAI